MQKHFGHFRPTITTTISKLWKRHQG